MAKAETPGNPAIGKLADQIRHAILEGVYSSDVAFPSLREFARRHHVSMRVVQGAMDLLEAEGLIYRRERRGTFVRGVPLATRRDDAGKSPVRCVNFVERPTGTLPDFVRSSYMHGYTEALEHFDVKMRVVNCPPRGGTIDVIAAPLFSPLFPYQEQGCVLINIVDPRLIEWLNARKVPFVVQSNICYERDSLPPHHAVMVNKFAGGMVAVRHLIGLGHERIGFMGVREAGDGALAPLYRGYEAAMREAGLEVRDQDVLELIETDPAHALDALHQYFARSNRPTAVVSGTDMIAFTVIRAARDMQLSVPHDLSVVGYNDQEEASLHDPPFTTVSNHRVLLGRSAVELLFEVAADRHEQPKYQVLQPRLIERQSTSKPHMPPVPGRLPMPMYAPPENQ